MAVQFAPKAPSDVREYRWTPKEGDCPSGSSVTVSTGSATVTDELSGEDVLITVTGGTAGVTQILAASATVGDETITETLYVPVIASANALARTGQDIASAVLRPVVGIGETAQSAETELALELLTEMLGSWRRQGADMGVPLPVSTSTVFYCPDDEIAAIKANLALLVRPEFTDGWEPTSGHIRQAARGLQLVKSARLPRDRAPVEYF